MKNYRYLLLMLFTASFAFNPINAAQDGFFSIQPTGSSLYFDFEDQRLTTVIDVPEIERIQDTASAKVVLQQASNPQTPSDLDLAIFDGEIYLPDTPSIPEDEDRQKDDEEDDEEYTASAQPVLQQASNPQTYPYPAKRFQCIVCLTGCASKDALDKHTKTHTGERSFKCSHEGCNAAFALSCALTRHTRTHTGEKPFKCGFEGCNAAFPRKDGLRTHTRTHTGEKPFKCTFDGCSAAFAQEGNLNAHNRIHTGEKPFKCTIEGCNAAFAQESNLNAHNRIHTGEQPFKCTFNGCDAAFTSRSSLKIHKRTHTNT